MDTSSQGVAAALHETSAPPAAAKPSLRWRPQPSPAVRRSRLRQKAAFRAGAVEASVSAAVTDEERRAEGVDGLVWRSRFVQGRGRAAGSTMPCS
jgi:hypothetical protein